MYSECRGVEDKLVQPKMTISFIEGRAEPKKPVPYFEKYEYEGQVIFIEDQS